MVFVLLLIILGFLIEFLLVHFIYKITNNFLKNILLSVTVLVISFGAAYYILFSFSVFSILFFLISLYRIFNILRIAASKINALYLSQVSRKTYYTFMFLGVTLLTIWAIDEMVDFQKFMIVTTLSVFQFLVAFIFLCTTVRRLIKTKISANPSPSSNSELPSVTIAVPARNETIELKTCIESLISSDYPKLEILILDDCSQERKTPEIIRNYANEGVRFIKGTEPHATWFAKNNAYAQLSREASGEIIMFVGVDIIVKPNTIRDLVETMLMRNKRMISVIPTRVHPNRFQIALSQPIRYMWELTPPRKLFNRPPVLSSVWLIYKNDIKKFGGFAAVSRMVMPEVYFAKMISKNNDGYSLVRSNLNTGLISQKSLYAQAETAIRIRYPALHRKPEMVFIFAFLELVIIAGSFTAVLFGLVTHMPTYAYLLSGIAALLFCLSYSMVVIITKINSWYIAPFLAFPAVLFDVYLMHISMYKYEFSEVIWKGRDSCLPVMHFTTNQSLPN